MFVIIGRGNKPNVTARSRALLFYEAGRLNVSTEAVHFIAAEPISFSKFHYSITYLY